jgi:Rib/alpha/Esp surface antigen-like repeat protein
MKRILSFAAICSAVILVSCNKDKPIDKDFAYVIPSETILGSTTSFEDQSINVQTRTWTFEDGTPATASTALVDVVFSKSGEKKVTLTVNYADGTKDEVSKTITVKDAFSAAGIKIDGLTPKGCAKKGTAVTFSIDDFQNAVSGNVEYAWSFPGGTPATSTEASPKVVWNEQNNNVNVTCTITRSFDGAKIDLSTSLIAGNYPLLRNDEYTVFSFDNKDKEPNKAWYGWYGGSTDDCISVADGGANGSAGCLKINATAVNYAADMGASVFELAHRNNWDNNARMVVGQKYEVSFYMKAEAETLGEGAYAAFAKNKGEVAAICQWCQLFNWVPDWLNDPLRGYYAQTDWSEIFPGETFEVQGAQAQIQNFPMTSLQATSETDFWFENLISKDWKKYSFEFTLENGGEVGTELRNCYLAFGLTGVNATFYLDDVQINLIEE